MRFQIVLALAFAGFTLPAGSGQTTIKEHAASPAPVAAPEAAKQKTLSTRVVAYQIDAHLNATKQTIDATEYLTLPESHRQAAANFPLPSLPERVSAQVHIHDGSSHVRYARHKRRLGVGSKTLRRDYHFEIRSRWHGRPDEQDAIHPARRSQCRRPHRDAGDAAQAHRAGRIGAIPHDVSRPASRSGRAHWLQTRFLHGGPVVSEGRRVVAERVELPSISRRPRNFSRTSAPTMCGDRPQNEVVGAGGDLVASEQQR